MVHNDRNAGLKIAVTGAGGFIGSALVRHLKGEGHEVVPLSQGDLENPDFSGVETVIHCAALAHRTGSQRPTAQDFDRVNHKLTVELAERAKQAGVGRFIFVSTIYTVAGNAFPLKPDMRLAPQDDYSAAKARAEADLLKMRGIDIVIARPVLVYGPNARANLHALMRLCDTSLPLPFGLANNQRSFVSLTNVVRALDFLAKANAADVAGKAFHLAEPELRSTKDLVTDARAALNRAPGLLPVPSLLLKVALTALGRAGQFEQLFGDFIADSSSLTELGFQFQSGADDLKAMAITAAEH